MNEQTVRFLLQKAAQSIPRLDAEVLLASILQVSRASLFADPDKILSSTKINIFQNTVQKAEQGMPVAYLTGEREFWSLTLRVTPDTLIPRPETECLVEQVLLQVTAKKAVIADCGTGTGAIALALASERPAWQIHATDNSVKALALARDNAKNHGLTNIIFHQGNWCEALPALRFDAIVSNPPYLAADDPHLSALSYEPQTALVSGPDGLSDIRKIVQQAREYLTLDGRLFVEHGCDQGVAVRNIFVDAGFLDPVTFKDLADIERVTMGMLAHC